MPYLRKNISASVSTRQGIIWRCKNEMGVLVTHGLCDDTLHFDYRVQCSR